MIPSGYGQYLLQGWAVRLQKSFSDLERALESPGDFVKMSVFWVPLFGILILWPAVRAQKVTFHSETDVGLPFLGKLFGRD